MQKLSKFLKKTVMGGYSCVNTRMAFNTDIFLKDTKTKKFFLKMQRDSLNDSHPKLLKWMWAINMEWR